MDRSLASDFFLGSVCRQAPPLPPSFQDLADPAKALPPHLPQWVPKEECISPFPQFKSPSPKLPRTVGGSSSRSQSLSFPQATRTHQLLLLPCCPLQYACGCVRRESQLQSRGQEGFPHSQSLLPAVPMLSFHATTSSCHR